MIASSATKRFWVEMYPLRLKRLPLFPNPQTPILLHLRLLRHRLRLAVEKMQHHSPFRRLRVGQAGSKGRLTLRLFLRLKNNLLN